MYAGAYLEMSKSKYVKKSFKFLGCEIDVANRKIIAHDGKLISFDEPSE